MPEIILDGSPQDSARTWALMHFPNDENSRKLHSFLVALDKLVFSAKKEDLITVTTEGTVWRMLLHWPNLQNLAKAADESYKSGILAGIMLAAIYLMYVFYLPEPSIKKAISYVRALAQQSSYADGTRMNISPKKIRQCWYEFKPVAHLWAAYYINFSYPVAPQNALMSSHLIPFLEMAAGFFQFGRYFVPFRAEDPILDPQKCWTLPKGIRRKLPPVDKFPDRLIKILKPPPDQCPEWLAAILTRQYKAR